MMAAPLELGYAVAGKYVVERELGRGGMGAVYAVTHRVTGKRMAMKCLLPQLVYDGELVGRFMREAKVMGRLNHRHIVDVFDVGRDGDVLFIVMELLEGKPLSALLRDASMTLEAALVILLRAMEGVAAAHAHGVVHRDLKPDNIFVCAGASGRLDDPRVLDFGISRLDEPGGPQLTRTGVAMGTPYYMAYEQLSGQRDLDHRVDVYAMGVVLYEAIAGAPPFVGESLSAVAVRMLTTEAQDLAMLRPDLPKGLAAAVMRAISRQRDVRQPDMRALIDDLHRFVPRGAWAGEPSHNPLPLRRPVDASDAPMQSEIRARASSLPAPAPRRKARIGTAVTATLLAGAGLLYAVVDAPVEAVIADVPRMPQPVAPSAEPTPPTPSPTGAAPETVALPSAASTEASQTVDAGAPAPSTRAWGVPKRKAPKPSVQPAHATAIAGPQARPALADAGSALGEAAKLAPQPPPVSPQTAPVAVQPPASQPTESSNRAGRLTPKDF